MMSFFGSKKVELPAHNCVLPHALKIPALEKLVGKRVVLASNSPRRKEILRTFVGSQSRLARREGSNSCFLRICRG